MARNLYEIAAKFTGVDGITSSFKRVREEAARTSRTIINGSKEEKQAQTEALRAQRFAANEQKRIWREQITAQRNYIRSMKKELSELRDESQKATKIGAGGIGGLVATGGGLKVAGNLEDAMTDLRISIMRLGADGKVDMAGLNAQMSQFEALAIRLGNNLPGSTRDMANLFRSMREGGMGAKEILGGAGEAAAFLAVTSKEDFQELGKAYAQLSTMSSVSPEDQIKTADLLARIHTISGYKPSELIDAAKYAIPRGAAPLGLKGFSGLNTSLNVIGLMKRFGLEGTVGGEGIAALMRELTMTKKPQQKTLAALRGKGIDMQFFGKKGEFLGVENIIAQIEKLNKLSDLDRKNSLKKLFGDQGSSVAFNLMQIGTKGYQTYIDELNRVPPLQEKINLETKKFNTQLENIKGTAENTIAKTFLPLMEAAKPSLVAFNEGLGKVANFMGDHPTVAMYATAILGIGSAALVTTAGVLKIQTAINIWKITSAIAAAENRLLAGSFTGVGASAAGAARGVDAATGSAKRAGVAGALLRNGVYIGLVLSLEELARQAIATDQALSDMNASAKTAYDSYKKLKEVKEGKGEKVPEQITDSYASGALGALDVGGMFVTSLKDALTNETTFLDRSLTRSILSAFHPLAPLFMGRDRVGKATGILKDRAPELGNPEIMAKFIGKINSGAMKLDDGAKERLMKALAAAFPDSFKQATEQLSQQHAAAAAMLRSQFLPAISDASRALSGLNFLQPIIPPSQSGTGAGPRIPQSGEPPKRFFNSSPVFRLPSSYQEPQLRNIPALQAAAGARGEGVSVTVQVDARGASNPAEIEAAARRGVAAGQGDLVSAIRESLITAHRDRVHSV